MSSHSKTNFHLKRLRTGHYDGYPVSQNCLYVSHLTLRAENSPSLKLQFTSWRFDLINFVLWQSATLSLDLFVQADVQGAETDCFITQWLLLNSHFRFAKYLSLLIGLYNAIVTQSVHLLTIISALWIDCTTQNV